ncbi:MAG: hypothetical protein DRQ55_03535 [Planctomycetota bacterium]|nr:MAG: hypothetical protein DRQ55_03535 [Planctomycetota bacterium]
MVLIFAALMALAAALPLEDVVAPPSLDEFWKRWVEAKSSNEDDELDKVVRRYRSDADTMLNVLLDDISKADEQELYFEIRLLAWSLDRVDRGERFISRARFVIDLDMFGRGRRAIAMGRFETAIGLEAEARIELSDESWRAVLREFDGAAQAFADVNDVEFEIFCHLQSAQVEFTRQRLWHQGQYMKLVLALAQGQSLHSDAEKLAGDTLEAIRTRGIDPDGPETTALPGAAGGEGEGESSGTGGRALTSFVPNSEPQTFQLTLQTPKKGLPKLPLPSFYQFDQYQLWQQTWIDLEGPGEFDYLRGGRWRPDGDSWSLSRDGIETFLIDSNGDGEADARFAGSSTPTRVELTSSKGRTWPIMVCTLGLGELMFDSAFNYAPTEDGARVRFFLASYWEGKVQGETWRVFDCNMDGVFGVGWENFDDLVTDYSDDEHVTWFEPDGVQIGRAKKAIPLSSVMPVDDTFYRVTQDPEQETLTLQEMNLATGELQLELDYKVQPSHLVVREVDKLEGAYFDILPARRGQPVTLPVGTYQFCLGRIAKGSKTNQDQVRIYAGRAQPFKIEAGETTELAFGAPYDLTFKVTQDGQESVLDTRSMRVFGQAGEEYAMFFDQPLQPEVEVQTDDGKTLAKASKLRKVGVGEWEVNTGKDNILWFPYELRVDTPAGKQVQMQMTQKAHALLGGPFKSDWIR